MLDQAGVDLITQYIKNDAQIKAATSQRTDILNSIGKYIDTYPTVFIYDGAAYVVDKIVGSITIQKVGYAEIVKS